MGRELCQKDSCRSATFLTELGWFSVILVISFWVCNVMLMSAPHPNKKRVVFWESGNLPHIFLQVDESGGYFLGKWEGFSSFPKPYQLTYSKFTYAKRWKAGSFYFKVLPIPKRKGSCFFLIDLFFDRTNNCWGSSYSWIDGGPMLDHPGYSKQTPQLIGMIGSTA